MNEARDQWIGPITLNRHFWIRSLLRLENFKLHVVKLSGWKHRCAQHFAVWPGTASGTTQLLSTWHQVGVQSSLEVPFPKWPHFYGLVLAVGRVPSWDCGSHPLYCPTWHLHVTMLVFSRYDHLGLVKFLHSLASPRVQKQKLRGIFNFWAQKSQNTIDITLYCSN